MLARNGTTALRHARVGGLVTLPRDMRDFNAMNQAIPDNQVLFDGTAV